MMSRILSALGSESLMTPLMMSMPCRAGVFDDASIPCQGTRFRKPVRRRLVKREETDDEATFIATSYFGGGACR
jgi:hypothetical protein